MRRQNCRALVVTTEFQYRAANCWTRPPQAATMFLRVAPAAARGLILKFADPSDASAHKVLRPPSARLTGDARVVRVRLDARALQDGNPSLPWHRRSAPFRREGQSRRTLRQIEGSRGRFLCH